MITLRPILCIRALVCLMLLGATVFATETTAPAALPDWPDQAPSIYSQPLPVAVTQPTPPAATQSSATQSKPVIPASFAVPSAAEPIVSPVAEESSSPKNPRRLAPRRRDARKSPTDPAAGSLPSFGLSFDSVYTTGAALAVVLGVFFLCAALVRRGAKKSNSLLPEEVVSVLGRVPLAARQFAELVRVGNKLVLVSVTQSGVKPLTEITDPAEIDRLVGLCRQGGKGSSTEEFDQIFRKLADESAPAGFLGNEAPRIDSRLSAPADVFAAYRGSRSG